MQTSSNISSRVLALPANTEAQTYGLFALAIGLTLAGVVLGTMFGNVLLSVGFLLPMMIASLAIILTAPWWMDRSPLNMVLFVVFPLITGISITPYLLSILAGYVNAGSILVNALAATVCMSLGAAFFAYTTKQELHVMSRALFLGLIGLLIFGIFQIFVPSLRTGMAEVAFSGIAIVLFAAFMAYDFQRIKHMGRLGANPFMLALSLYLDLYNLFLFVLRFMLAISGNRRD